MTETKSEAPSWRHQPQGIFRVMLLGFVVVILSCSFDVKPIPDSEETITLNASDGTKMEFVLIQSGDFMMGSPSSEEGREDDETQHQVVLEHDYWLGKYEVTQAQYEAVMGTNPSKFRDLQAPVEQVSWNDAVSFCEKVSLSTGKTVRLPSEAEWEYACRAGSQTRYCYGDSDRGLGEYSWHYNNSEDQTHEVGLKRSNDWGLYDMHGNVSEWCYDVYDAYPGGSVAHSDGLLSSGSRVLRGGSWSEDPKYCRSANRSRIVPTYSYYFYGFRVAMTQ